MSTTTRVVQTPTLERRIVSLAASEEGTTNQPCSAAILAGEYARHLVRSIPASDLNLIKKEQSLSFCPLCKMLLRTPAGDHSLLRCKKCGYNSKIEHNVIVKTGRNNRQNIEIAVIDKEKGNLRTQTTVKTTCEKCGNTESEAWTISVGSEGTTSEITFLRCISCGYTRREVG